MPNDTYTVLNPGTGGDNVDETSTYQDNGSTSVKRARVDVGYQADDQRGRLVSKTLPLPVDATEILVDIFEELRAIRMLMLQMGDE